MCQFEGCNLWHEKLRRSFLAPAVPGRAKISWKQLQLADAALFDYVAEQLDTSDLGKKAGDVVTSFQKKWVEGTIEHSSPGKALDMHS